MLFRREKTSGQEEKRFLRAYSPFNLVDCFEELKTQGYFYFREIVYFGKEGVIWDDIITISIEFAHILTSEKKYLHIKKEGMPYGEETVMWISDCCGKLSYPKKWDRCTRDEIPILKTILQESGMILEPGVFQKLSLEALPEQTKESLFYLLYSLGYRQLRVGLEKVKKDYDTEDSFAWAGEFVGKWEQDYLYLVLVKRDFEEWDCIDNGDIVCPRVCIFRETYLDIYINRSREPMDTVCPEGEAPVRLKPIPGENSIRKYLDDFANLDFVLQNYINDKEEN